MNMYIKHSSLRSFYITPKHHPILFKKKLKYTIHLHLIFPIHFSAFNKNNWWVVLYNRVASFQYIIYIQFNIIFKIEKSSISNTNLITTWIKLLTIIFWITQVFNMSVFWYGYIKRKYKTFMICFHRKINWLRIR